MAVTFGEPILFLRNETGIPVNNAARGRELPGFSYIRSYGNGLGGFRGGGRNLWFWRASPGVDGNRWGSRSDSVGWPENSRFLCFTTLSDLAVAGAVTADRNRCFWVVAPPLQDRPAVHLNELSGSENWRRTS